MIKPGSNCLRIVGIGHEIATPPAVLRPISSSDEKRGSEVRRLAALKILAAWASIATNAFAPTKGCLANP